MKKLIFVLSIILIFSQGSAFAFKIFGKDDNKDKNPIVTQDNNQTNNSDSSITSKNSSSSLNNKNENIPYNNNRASFADAVAKAEPAVVSIQTTKEMPNELHPLLQDPFFKFFFNDPYGDEKQSKNNLPKQLQQGLGSGVIVNKKGYVLTNNHVIKDAKSISVKLPDGRISEATVIGSDPTTDLAVLKVNNLKDLPEIQLGSSENLKVGDIVLAIGNPLGFARTVTLGIVSATGSVQQRLASGKLEGFSPILDNLIQTDASINPGNSGGALIDSLGQLIGINMAIITNKYDSSSTGIGFAIPIDLAKTIMQQLIDNGHIIRGWLGAYLAEMTDELKKYLNYKENHGVYVRAIFKNSPAQKAGLLPGDVIVKINGQEANNINSAVLVSNLSPNKGYPFEIFRKGEYIVFSVVIIERPKETE